MRKQTHTWETLSSKIIHLAGRDQSKGTELTLEVGSWKIKNIGGWVSVDISNTRKEPCTAQKYIHYPQEVFLKSQLWSNLSWAMPKQKGSLSKTWIRKYFFNSLFPQTSHIKSAKLNTRFKRRNWISNYKFIQQIQFP